MMSDDQAGLFMLSMLVTWVVGPAAIAVWLLCRALRQSRARDGAGHAQQRGFEIIAGRRTETNDGHGATAFENRPAQPALRA